MGRGIRGSPRAAVVPHSPWLGQSSPPAPGKLQHGQMQSGAQDPMGDLCPAGCCWVLLGLPPCRAGARQAGAGGGRERAARSHH